MKTFLTHLLVLLLTFNIGQAQHIEKDNPLRNFDYLWQLFDQNYASFSEKEIDWDAMGREYRATVNDEMTERALFRILTDMLRPLHDDHVNLIARDLDTAFTASRPSRIIETLRPVPGKERRPLFNAAIDQTLAEHGFRELTEIGPEYSGRKLFAFTDNGKLGYLRFTRSFTQRKFLNLVSLDRLLERVFSSFQELEGLIIDIRFNMGGDDSFSKKVAGRLVAEKMLSYYKQTRKNGTFGVLKPHYLHPRGKSKFLRPVVLLTNDKTVSAADVLALMMSQLPQVSLIGTPSNGSYSDLMAKKLPNGWTVTLSNQRYLSREKINYEGRGTPVDIRLENTLEAIRAGKDEVLEKAIRSLGPKR